MAGLYWMAVTMTVLLSAGNSLAVDPVQLSALVNDVLAMYKPSMALNDGHIPMFSLAVSIPFNPQTQQYDIRQVPDTPAQVGHAIQRCSVYTGTRVLAATLLRWPDVLNQCPNERVPLNLPWIHTLQNCRRSVGAVNTWAHVSNRCPHPFRQGTVEHAESRTARHLNTLMCNQNDFVVFYVFTSPCANRCTSNTDPMSILNDISNLRRWNNRAFVFSHVFTNDVGNAAQHSLERLGPRVGRDHIFRCYRAGQMQCTPCFSGRDVTEACFTN